ncbi:glycoside hydrolase domain-containing protein [Streptomyces klenkii]|uniref:glycoside hydrolase domain-containing protein n=1 Tax=Streptomyces klenkii TaxID=1420899 RepID=UPI00342CAC92
MADEMVRKAQMFINTAYQDVPGVSKVPENGKPGWNNMFALTRALQYEAGISQLSDTFGPGTIAAVTAKWPAISHTVSLPENVIKIIQSALYCKGYDGGDIDGKFNARVQASLGKIKSDMGVTDYYGTGSVIDAKVLKAMLNMDAYVTVNSGSDAIRGVQQWLNGRYVKRRDFFIIPCDGHNSRDVAKSMLFAVQYELGMADGAANGIFGPGTQGGLRDHALSVGSQGSWVTLFQAAMILNKRSVAFSGAFDSSLGNVVREFQSFVKLPVTGNGDFSTWCSLLVSYGDQSRKGEACDGVTMITPARAATLKAEGIKYVGRYLINPSATKLREKAIQPGELQTIADHGLRCFPIYQTYGREADGFNYPLGRAAGQAAVNAALDHGFKRGTRIFFAVDFDALDHEVTDVVLPYFKGIVDAVADDGNRYEIGVYGPRNVCTRVAEAGHSSASFVSDMSSAYSGNFGYPLPPDWAYDQFVTRSVGSGDGGIDIDNSIASGRDTGQGSFDSPRSVKPDTRLDSSVVKAMMDDVGKYMQSIGFPNDGGLKTYQHWKCFQTVVVDHDDLITELSNRYNMRKALIQTTAYWEMRHIGVEDQASDAATIAAYNTTGRFVESSTGIAQSRGITALWAWNYCINKGYVTGRILDQKSDSDIYSIWSKVYDSEDFDLRTVCMVHLWDSEGKPGGDHDEQPLRSMGLNYTEYEVFEILRRYQGFGKQAEADNMKRAGLYQVMEKYNAISRAV